MPNPPPVDPPRPPLVPPAAPPQHQQEHEDHLPPLTPPPPEKTPAPEKKPSSSHRLSANSHLTRSSLLGRADQGIVACSQPQAAEAGLSILRSGGNCADAAVAVAFALNVVEPIQCGVGGDVFALYWDELGGGKVVGMNGSGRSPTALTWETVSSFTLAS